MMDLSAFTDNKRTILLAKNIIVSFFITLKSYSNISSILFHKRMVSSRCTAYGAPDAEMPRRISEWRLADHK